jgi:hypothetical protein
MWLLCNSARREGSSYTPVSGGKPFYRLVLDVRDGPAQAKAAISVSKSGHCVGSSFSNRAFTSNTPRFRFPTSLNNLAIMLRPLDKEKSLAAFEEAVSLYRALAEARPDAFAPFLATLLTSYPSY